MTRSFWAIRHPPELLHSSLVLAVGLQHHLFPRCDQRAIQRRMAEFAGEQWVVEAVAHTINATDAALGILPFDRPIQ